ncbi:MAG: hypothetical protein FJX74_03430 [Armatimonadetes bacterium]|nr:hypothetical protein [Armatimonadota bacterium]
MWELIAMAALAACMTSSAGEVALLGSNPEGVRLPAWPVVVGVPFPAGKLADADRVAVVDSTGNPMAPRPSSRP